MPQTPDRRPGALIEDDEIILKDNTSGDPTEVGAIRQVGGVFRMKDAMGVFDPRSGGGGITEAQHEVLDTLVHDIDETSYDEVTYGSGGRVVSYVVWETAAKLKKIREEQYTYVSGKVSQVVTFQYDGAGVVKMTMTEAYAYSGGKVVSVTRTKS